MAWVLLYWLLLKNIVLPLPFLIHLHRAFSLIDFVAKMILVKCNHHWNREICIAYSNTKTISLSVTSCLHVLSVIERSCSCSARFEDNLLHMSISCHPPMVPHCGICRLPNREEMPQNHLH